MSFKRGIFLLMLVGGIGYCKYQKHTLARATAAYLFTSALSRTPLHMQARSQPHTYTAHTRTPSTAHIHARMRERKHSHEFPRTNTQASKSRSCFLVIKILSEIVQIFNCALLVAYLPLHLVFTGAGMVYQTCDIAERNNLKTDKQTELSLYSTLT